MFNLLVCIGILCLLFGLVYPMCAAVFYPVYRSFIGKIRFSDYMRDL